jgi:hypothetical protein
MKRGLLLFALSTALVGWVVLAAPPPKPGPPVLAPAAKPMPGPKPAAASSTPPVDNSRPEPSAVYGYVTVVDPASGQHYISDPNATPSERGTGLSFPKQVVFRRTADPSQTFTLNHPAPGGTYYRTPPAAVWYSVPFLQDASAGDLPVFNYRDGKVHYDPAKWRFLRLDMGPVEWNEMTDAGVSSHVSVAVSPTAQISDFPDFSSSLVYGPSR